MSSHSPVPGTGIFMHLLGATIHCCRRRGTLWSAPQGSRCEARYGLCVRPSLHMYRVIVDIFASMTSLLEATGSPLPVLSRSHCPWRLAHTPCSQIRPSQQGGLHPPGCSLPASCTLALASVLPGRRCSGRAGVKPCEIPAVLTHAHPGPGYHPGLALPTSGFPPFLRRP